MRLSHASSSNFKPHLTASFAPCEPLVGDIAGPSASRSSSPPEHSADTWPRGRVIDAFIALASAAIIIRRLVRSAWTTHRWDTRPARRP